MKKITWNQTKSFAHDVAVIYFKKRVTRGAAALSYYLTMTIFPLLICLYTMLGTQYKQATLALGIVQDFMAEETFNAILDFLSYVAANNSTAMLVAALLVLVTSASASFRSFQMTVGEMQGEIRFTGFFGFLFSMAFSIVFLAAIYIAILIIITGSWFVNMLGEWMPVVSINTSWTWFRFIILFGVVFLLIYMLYLITVPAGHKYKVMTGALSATMALVIVSIVFSMFIGVSAKYPLVYGSLASIILLMFWLYLSALMLIMGAVVNIVIRNRKQDNLNEDYREEDETAAD